MVICSQPECQTTAGCVCKRTSPWVCGARKQGTAGGNDPADCDWPTCGCDPYATKVIDALVEQGHLQSDHR